MVLLFSLSPHSVLKILFQISAINKYIHIYLYSVCTVESIWISFKMCITCCLKRRTGHRQIIPSIFRPIHFYNHDLSLWISVNILLQIGKFAILQSVNYYYPGINLSHFDSYSTNHLFILLFSTRFLCVCDAYFKMHFMPKIIAINSVICLHFTFYAIPTSFASFSCNAEQKKQPLSPNYLFFLYTKMWLIINECILQRMSLINRKGNMK